MNAVATAPTQKELIDRAIQEAEEKISTIRNIRTKVFYANFYQRQKINFNSAIEKAIFQVCKYTGISDKEFWNKAKSRKRKYATARYIVYGLMRNHYKCTYTRIADHFDRDHTTVINGCEKLNDRLFWDKQFKEEYTALENEFIVFLNQA